MNIIEQLRRDEGIKYLPYEDTEGNLSIGVGTLLPLDDNEVNALLEIRLNNISRELHIAIPWIEQLDDVRWDALRNMAYNMGVPRLLEFKKMLSALRKGDFLLAGKEALDSQWAKEVGDRSLRIAKQLATGVME